MTRDADLIQPELRAWLTGDATAVEGWAPDPPRVQDLRCHPDLVAHLAEIARPIPGTARIFVGGCPVIHAAGGPPVAAASGTTWLAVGCGRDPGELASPHGQTPWLPDGWFDVDPAPRDVAFARGVDRVRTLVADAMRRIGAV